jgi:hypothetical protein
VRRVWRSGHSSIAWGCGKYIGQQQGQETAVMTKYALCSFVSFVKGCAGVQQQKQQPQASAGITVQKC